MPYHPTLSEQHSTGYLAWPSASAPSSRRDRLTPFGTSVREFCMADLRSLLEATSRTFAPTIALLPEPLQYESTVAYLLFRLADTFEDATRWRRDRRHAALSQLAALLRGQAEP